MSASDATKSKLLVLVDVLIKNEIVFEIVGFGFSILVAQGARKKKEKQRKSIKEKEYLNVRKTFNFTFYHFQSFLLKPTRITTRPSSAMHGALGNASQLGSE